jgi:glycosyl transferase family 1
VGLRILYGVNGEGLGHATRSQVVAGVDPATKVPLRA